MCLLFRSQDINDKYIIIIIIILCQELIIRYNDIRKKEKLVKSFLHAIRRLLFLERKKLRVITLPDYESS